MKRSLLAQLLRPDDRTPREHDMSATTALPTGTWNVDPAHSHIAFHIKHLGISTVRGEFGEYQEITFQSSRSSPRTRTPTRSPVT